VHRIRSWLGLNRNLGFGVKPAVVGAVDTEHP
jgi:hypothetical protein